MQAFREDQEPRGKRQLSARELLAICGVWTFVALLSSANRLLDLRERGGAWPGFAEPVLHEFFEAYIWALLTPFIFWLSSRVRIERSHWLRPALLLIAAAFATAVFVDVAEDLFDAVALDRGGRGGLSLSRSVLRLWFLNEFMVFVAVLAVGFAREYFLRYQGRQDEATRLQARASALEAQLAEARLEALRMQINPHFLFNTLHAVSSLVDRDPDGVRRMIAHLAGLLRVTLRAGSEPEVTLEREFEFLERYLEIMRIRFGERLTVDFQVEPDLLNSMVPNLILQPLVENAIKHAVAPTTAPAHVVVSAVVEQDRLVLVVQDDGPGVGGPASADAAEACEGSGEGVGLDNVRQRLARLYEGAADLRLESAAAGGVRAEIRLPLRHRTSPAASAVETSEVGA